MFYKEGIHVYMHAIGKIGGGSASFSPPSPPSPPPPFPVTLLILFYNIKFERGREIPLALRTHFISIVCNYK